MKLFVGIDVSSKTLEISMIDSDRSTVFSDQFENDLTGATLLKKKILELNRDNHYDKIVIGLEATSIYSFHPAYFLQTDDDLAQFDIDTVVINPRNTKRYHDVFDESKTDKIDAYDIADYLRNGRYKVSLVRHEQYIALQRLTRTRYELVKELVRTKQHFLESLYYKANKLVVDDKLKHSVFGAAVFELLTSEMTTDEIMNMPFEDLAAYLSEKGRGRFSDPEQLAKDIQKALRDSYRLDKVVADSINVVLATLAAELQSLNKSIKSLEKAISKIVKGLPEYKILTSIPGIGDIYSAGIIAEIGQSSRFDREASLANYAGLAWNQKQSGDYSSSNTSMSHSGDRYLRYYLVEAANRARLKDPVFKKYYDKKYKEVGKSPMKRALVLTARKLVRVVFVLLEKNQLYVQPKIKE